MKVNMSWQDCGMDTVNGHTVKVVQTYSSFDEEEIIKLVDSLKQILPGVTIVSTEDYRTV